MPGDGRHQLKPWHDQASGRGGFACARCSKTWEHVTAPFGGETILETYELLADPGLRG